MKPMKPHLLVRYTARQVARWATSPTIRRQFKSASCHHCPRMFAIPCIREELSFLKCCRFLHYKMCVGWHAQNKRKEYPMPREHEDYRRNMEILNTRYPNYDMLTVQEALVVTGIKSRITLHKHLGDCFANHRISKAALARWMCGK